MVFPIDLQPTPVSMISMVSIMIMTTVNDCIYSSDMLVFSLASILAVKPAFNWRFMVHYLAAFGYIHYYFYMADPFLDPRPFRTHYIITTTIFTLCMTVVISVINSLKNNHSHQFNNVHPPNKHLT